MTVGMIYSTTRNTAATSINFVKVFGSYIIGHNIMCNRILFSFAVRVYQNHAPNHSLDSIYADEIAMAHSCIPPQRTAMSLVWPQVTRPMGFGWLHSSRDDSFPQQLTSCKKMGPDSAGMEDSVVASV